MRPQVYHGRLVLVGVEQGESHGRFERDRFRHPAGELESGSGRNTGVFFELRGPLAQPSGGLLLKTGTHHGYAHASAARGNCDHSLGGWKAAAAGGDLGGKRSFRQMRGGYVRRHQDMRGVLFYQLPAMNCRLADGAAGASEECQYGYSAHGFMILVSVTSLD